MVGVTLSLARSLVAAPATPAAAPPVTAAPTGAETTRLAPILDQPKGERAAAAFRASVAALCAEMKGGRDARPARFSWDQLGVSPSAEDALLCGDAPPGATPLASGSFLAAGEDEVLLDVDTRASWAAGDHGLLVMRQKDGAFRPVRLMGSSNGFRARARIVVPGRTDVVMVCEDHGHMGLYPSTCGFLGQGGFRAVKAGALKTSAGRGGLPLGFTTLCGPTAAISLGKIALSGHRLDVEVVVEEAVLERNPKEDDEDSCSKRTAKPGQSFDIVYDIGGKSVRRVTPIPRGMTEVADRFDFN
jgi:hypothetical protein